LPHFQGADATATAAFTDGGDVVETFVAFYVAQRDGAELLWYGNALYDGEVWRRAGGGHAGITIDGRSLEVAQVRLLSRRGGRLVWSWYWVDGRYTADPRVAKLLYLKAVLTGANPAMATVAIAADYVEAPTEARAVLERFIADLGPLRPWLAAAGS
jgi:EpsI family protein